jgi:mannose-6-phosphate isomerase
MPELDQLAARYQDWLVGKALPLWSSKGVDAQCGGFHELLGDDGVAPPAPKRARVQARQSFTFLYAQAMGWDGPWTDVAHVGLDHLNRFYLRPDGLYATLADRAGTILDSTAMTYDQAFVLLALAYVYKRTGDADARGKAEALMARLMADRGLPNGGFREANDAFLSNPHMHLFEASLAWIEVAGQESWIPIARGIASLAHHHFIDNQKGVLFETFDDQWKPLGEGTVEPGHQFEWAWLLERWSRIGGEAWAHDAALSLFKAGERGVDAARGAAVDETDADLRPRRATARLWPQTERIKAAMILGEHKAATAGAECLWRYLDSAGLWRDKMDEAGKLIAEPAPASSLYHIICAVAALR